MYKVHKIINESVEYLPFWEDTELRNDYNEFCPNKRMKLITDLYSAVMNRENYYQYNTPTMYGNPDFDFKCGVVHGILLAGNIEEEQTETEFIYRKGKRKILVVDKLNRPRAYHESRAENARTRRALGL